MKKFTKVNCSQNAFKTTFRTAAIFLCLFVIIKTSSAYTGISGTVYGSGSPVSGASVTLFAAGTGAPVQVGQSKTNDEGKFDISNLNFSGEGIFYLIAKDGKITGSIDQTSENSLTLISLLGSDLPSNVIINELTTVASAYTAARFLDGESVSGNLLGLKIAAGNTPTPSRGCIKTSKTILPPRHKIAKTSIF